MQLAIAADDAMAGDHDRQPVAVFYTPHGTQGKLVTNLLSSSCASFVVPRLV